MCTFNDDLIIEEPLRRADGRDEHALCDQGAGEAKMHEHVQDLARLEQEPGLFSPEAVNDKAVQHDVGAYTSFSGRKRLDVDGPSNSDCVQSQGFGGVEEHSLVVAERLGRGAEAYRQLLELEAAGGNPREFLAESSIERIRRIGATYERSLKLLGSKVTNYATNEKNLRLNLEWGMELKDGLLRMMYVCEHDIDLVKVLAFGQEVDLQGALEKDMVRAEPVGEQQANDAMWHIISHDKTLGTKTDELVFASTLDALSEPIGSIWNAAYTPPQDMTELEGVPLPMLEKGYSRPSYSFAATLLTPLSVDGGAVQRCRQISVFEARLPKVVNGIMSVMPAFLLKRFMRTEIEKRVASLAPLLKTSSEHEQRMLTSPRREFYEHVQWHLAAEPAPPAMPPN